MPSVMRLCSLGTSPPPSSALTPKDWSGTSKIGWGFGSASPAAHWAAWWVRFARWISERSSAPKALPESKKVDQRRAFPAGSKAPEMFMVYGLWVLLEMAGRLD